MSSPHDVVAFAVELRKLADTMPAGYEQDRLLRLADRMIRWADRSAVKA